MSPISSPLKPANMTKATVSYCQETHVMSTMDRSFTDQSTLQEDEQLGLSFMDAHGYSPRGWSLSSSILGEIFQEQMVLLVQGPGRVRLSLELVLGGNPNLELVERVRGPDLRSPRISDSVLEDLPRYFVTDDTGLIDNGVYLGGLSQLTQGRAPESADIATGNHNVRLQKCADSSRSGELERQRIGTARKETAENMARSADLKSYWVSKAGNWPLTWFFNTAMGTQRKLQKPPCNGISKGEGTLSPDSDEPSSPVTARPASRSDRGGC
ncbi:hypothetical protein MJG53_002519 [Ovis ammon polii x Ovis aries]|uniref:Uncharacterized protein n=1 Tax=Ovis ammon polii x Ovis aries TaxID=2918886 RepID=A0ACB9VF59_9CETA|nr:hypothetical protein MJG53_002519 [Ovis ammon polii x Ovis aries]